MRFTIAEYQRGRLIWEPGAGVTFQFEGTSQSGLIVLTRLTDASGAILPERWGDRIGLKVLPQGAEGRLKQVRLESLRGVRIWDNGFGGDPTVEFVRIPNYGFFHRLVVDAGLVEWPEDCIIRGGDALVVFREGEVRGEKIRGFDEFEVMDTGHSQTGLIASATAVGRMIEIVAPGASADDAELRARALLGLIALVFGDAALRKVVFDEAYEGTRDEQRYVARLPVSQKQPRRLSEAEVSQIDAVLPSLLTSDATPLLRALHWYQRGIDAISAEDALVSFMVGIETLANSHESTSPYAKALREERVAIIDAAREPLVEALGRESAGRIRGEFISLTLAERVQAYATDLGLAPEVVEPFGQVNGTRNDLLHGRLAAIPEKDADDAKMLLVGMLRPLLGASEKFGWEDAPRIVGSTRIHMTIYPDDRAQSLRKETR